MIGILHYYLILINKTKKKLPDISDILYIKKLINNIVLNILFIFYNNKIYKFYNIKNRIYKRVRACNKFIIYFK